MERERERRKRDRQRISEGIKTKIERRGERGTVVKERK